MAVTTDSASVRGPQLRSDGAASATTRQDTQDTQNTQNTLDHEHEQQHARAFIFSPQAEEGIKAAISAARSMPTKINKNRWVLCKYILRSLSLACCAAMFLGEIIFAASYIGPYIDTGFGITWAVLLASWDIWRIERLRRSHGLETATTYHVAIEGTAVLAEIVAFVAIVCVSYTVWPHWYRARGNLLVIVFVLLLVIHIPLFWMACVEKWRAMRQEDIRAGRINLSEYPHVQTPAQIIVQYTHVCSNCGTRSEPKPGEALNEHLAARGELQPQIILLPNCSGHGPS
ncbi:hypothetical protein BX600DRAFT_512603 [Xylariales sp. PMI_506]|nr:hypothetical protein BX600DRAFT_512603 [Xylariales sp. PMI_506]